MAYKGDKIDKEIIDTLIELGEANIRQIWKRLEDRGIEVTEPTVNFRLRDLEEKDFVTSKERKIPNSNLMEKVYHATFYLFPDLMQTTLNGLKARPRITDKEVNELRDYIHNNHKTIVEELNELKETMKLKRELQKIDADMNEFNLLFVSAMLGPVFAKDFKNKEKFQHFYFMLQTIHGWMLRVPKSLLTGLVKVSSQV
jgi:DNA-binding Lrp family transcriptional regulator